VSSGDDLGLAGGQFFVGAIAALLSSHAGRSEMSRRAARLTTATQATNGGANPPGPQ
jgi:hypothetical protein